MASFLAASAWALAVASAWALSSASFFALSWASASSSALTSASLQAMASCVRRASSSAAASSPLTWAVAAPWAATAVSPAAMAATVEAWMAIPCPHSAASSWAMPEAPSIAALCCMARCRATRRLQGTPQARSQARATSLWSGATLLLELAWSAGILPRWADSTSLLGPDFLRCS